MEKSALYIGRFQPFHKGHEDTILQMAKAEDIAQIVVGIGSSQYSNYFGNPFTASERAEFIKRSLGDKFIEIVEIPDLHDFPKWAPYVESICPNFQVIYSGNTIVKELFETRGCEVRTPKFNFDISASLIRNLMVEDGPWQNLVPVGTREFLEEISGAERVKRLHNKYVKANVTSDLIIEDELRRIILIERGHEPFAGMWALPGGYLNVGTETTLQAAAREAKEETSKDVPIETIKRFGVYDALGRDPRGPTISHVFTTEVRDAKFKAKDDAKKVRRFKREDIPEIMAFDHRQILEDYFAMKDKEQTKLEPIF